MSEVFFTKPSKTVYNWCKKKYLSIKDTPLCFKALEANSTVSLICLEYDEEEYSFIQAEDIKASLQYSTDNMNTWNVWDGSVITLSEVGKKVYIKALSTNERFAYKIADEYTADSYFHNFILTGKISSFGNIQFLLDPTGKQTSVSDECFFNLFATYDDGKAVLRTAPSLFATELDYCCYSYMFAGNACLKEIPDLPALTLAEGCYCGMFEACGSLRGIIKLPATTLADWCYSGMFESTYYITEILMSGIEEGQYDPDMHGEFYWGANFIIYYGTMPDPIAFTGEPLCFVHGLLTSSNNENENTLKAVSAGSASLYAYKRIDGEDVKVDIPVSLQYSIDEKQTWHVWDGTAIDLYNASTKLFVKALDRNYNFAVNIDDEDGEEIKLDLILTGSITVLGTMESLLNSEYNTQILPPYVYYNLFTNYHDTYANANGLKSAPELTCTNLNIGCYEEMFSNCISLTAMPELPATILYNESYYWMFAICKSLTQTNTFNALSVDEYSCKEMFLSCTALTSVMDNLSADLLYYYSYKGMFLGCTSLSTAPYLCATVFDDDYNISCYANMLEYTQVSSVSMNPAAQTIYDSSKHGKFAYNHDVEVKYEAKQ